jgi:hypothetical protein
LVQVRYGGGGGTHVIKMFDNIIISFLYNALSRNLSAPPQPADFGTGGAAFHNESAAAETVQAFDFIVEWRVCEQQLLPPVLFVYVPHLCADQIAARTHRVVWCLCTCKSKRESESVLWRKRLFHCRHIQLHISPLSRRQLTADW